MTLLDNVRRIVYGDAMSITQTHTRRLRIVNPRLEKAEAQYRKDAARAATRADRAQDDEEYNRAISDLHAANERLALARDLYPVEYIEVPE